MPNSIIFQETCSFIFEHIWILWYHLRKVIILWNINFLFVWCAYLNISNLYITCSFLLLLFLLFRTVRVVGGVLKNIILWKGVRNICMFCIFVMKKVYTLLDMYCWRSCCMYLDILDDSRLGDILLVLVWTV